MDVQDSLYFYVTLSGNIRPPCLYILLYGGFCVNEKSRERLCSIIKIVKSEYDEEADFPLKWNFQSLKDYFLDQGRERLYKQLLQSSREWRTRIFKEIAPVDFTVVMSVIHGYGKTRNVQKRTKEQLTRYVFYNALQRFGLHISEIGSPYKELVLDWPPGGNRFIFDDEFRCAYIHGKDTEQKEYYCKALKNIGFADAPFYSSTNECSLLQLSDLMVGALSELIDVSLGRTEGNFGYNRVREIKDKFRGAPNMVIGRGISMAPPDNELSEMIKPLIDSLYEDSF